VAEQATAKAAPVSQVYTWEPSNSAIAARYGLRPQDILRFDLNTSPTRPDVISAALAGPFEPPLNEYPDSGYEDLVVAAAGYVGVDPSEIVVGAGADEVLDIIAKACLGPGDRALLPLPTYSMYGVLSSQRNARIEPVPRLGPAEGFGLDLDGLLPRLQGAALLWLCDPNNPTGSPEAPDVLERVLDVAHGLGEHGPVVAVDEAYVEFHPRTLIPLRHRFPRLVVVRTVSKAFGLAGVRVGYAVAARALIERLEARRPPGSVSTISAHVAALALRRPDVARANAARLGDEREWLAARLADIGLPPYPSVTNFLLVPMGGQEAAESATDWLLRRGIVTRTFGPANPLRGHLRFTTRTRDQNERFLEVLEGWQKERAA
jgi:histidinol-phosphate aminotransferase